MLVALLPLGLPLPFAEHALVQAACLAPALHGCSRTCAQMSATQQGGAICSVFVYVAQVRAAAVDMHCATACWDGGVTVHVMSAGRRSGAGPACCKPHSSWGGGWRCQSQRGHACKC